MNNIFEKIINRFKGLHKSRLINPHTHWLILVVLFLITALILIIFGIYLLFMIRNDEVFQVIPDSPTITPSLIKEKLLEKINDSFSKKEIITNEIESGNINFVDPS